MVHSDPQWSYEAVEIIPPEKRTPATWWKFSSGGLGGGSPPAKAGGLGVVRGAALAHQMFFILSLNLYLVNWEKNIEVTSMELNIFVSFHLATVEQSAYSLELGMEERIPPNIS